MFLLGNFCFRYCVFKYCFCLGVIFIYRLLKYVVNFFIYIIKLKCFVKYIYDGEKCLDKSRFE